MVRKEENKIQRTRIEWVKNPDNETQGYSSNPVKGYCPIACPYCYARALYDRFGWDKTIRFDVKELLAIEKHKKPAGIFLGSTFELFWDGLERFWQDSIFRTTRACPQHRFFFLTKQPQNLIQFSPFPLNCWVGITATNIKQYVRGLVGLKAIQAKVKYVSFEPLLDYIPIGSPYDLDDLNWVIIGGCSGRQKFYPPRAWVDEIISAADNAKIPIFEKNNLYPAGFRHLLRQEMPK